MNIAILSCKNIKDESCIGCHRCLTAVDKREGAFERYKDRDDIKLKAILHCGGCPGAGAVNRLANLKTWIAPMGDNIDAIHIGSCLLKFCPHKDIIIERIKEKAGVEVIEGSHYYAPPTIFGS